MTVNRHLLLSKVNALNYSLKDLLANRRSVVQPENRQTRWRNQKNGVRKCSITLNVQYLHKGLNTHTKRPSFIQTTEQLLFRLVLLKILILFKKSKISDFFDKNRIIIKKNPIKIGLGRNNCITCKSVKK